MSKLRCLFSFPDAFGTCRDTDVLRLTVLSYAAHKFLRVLLLVQFGPSGSSKVGPEQLSTMRSVLCLHVTTCSIYSQSACVSSVPSK